MPPIRNERRRSSYDKERYHPYRTRQSTDLEHHQYMDAPRLDVNAITNAAAGENMAGSGVLHVTGNGAPIPLHNYPGHGWIQGWIEYGAITNGRRSAMRALVTSPMIGAGTAPSYDFPFITHRSAYLYARGHLLAKTLGGSGGNARNLVPLMQNRANLRMYHAFESKVRYAVANIGVAVEYSVTPVYWTPTSLWPSELTMKAKNFFDGSSIVKTFHFSTGV